jgi:uncharacterized protein (TIGR02996 family)
MTDTDALLAAILTDPADDTVRLAYADAIEEQGQHERAEFIRVQIELVKMPSMGSKQNDPRYVLPTPWERLRARERELLNHVYWPNWCGPACKAITPIGRKFDDHIHWSRGFVSAVTCTAADWLAHADAIYWHPSQTARGMMCKWCKKPQPPEPRSVDLDFLCRCGGEWSTGRIPRPFVATAQPIERVVLTSWAPSPPFLYRGASQLGGLIAIGECSHPQFPGITFEVRPSAIWAGDGRRYPITRTNTSS